MLYPIIFNPVYKQTIWGGTSIAKRFNRTTPFEKIAESWELCARPDGMGIVTNGSLRGLTFARVIEKYKEKLLGTESIKKYGYDFPLLIKLIDANDKLSVQVHPDDAYARSKGEKSGKNELWYIIDAKPGAKLVCGLRGGVTKNDFADAVHNGKISETLREVPAAPGDAFYIPAGTVHAILDGILLAEIQQNSNTTYRIYDWDRLDADGRQRTLHINEALEVIAFNKHLPEQTLKQPQFTENANGSRKTVLRSDFFNIDEIALDGSFGGEATGDTFYALMNLKNKIKITYDGGETNLTAGDTALIPACLGKYTVTGQSGLLLSWI